MVEEKSLRRVHDGLIRLREGLIPFIKKYKNDVQYAQLSSRDTIALLRMVIDDWDKFRPAFKREHQRARAFALIAYDSRNMEAHNKGGLADPDALRCLDAMHELLKLIEASSLELADRIHPLVANLKRLYDEQRRFGTPSPDPTWQQIRVELDVFSPSPPKSYPNDWINRVVWKDIFWLDKSHGWLAGAVTEGGGHGDVGLGALLSSHGGPTWHLIPNENFDSGRGSFTWGPTGTRPYRWTDVGPINTIRFYMGAASDGRRLVEAWAATATGVYRSINAGRTWVRSTPPPDAPERYAFFSGLVGVEGFAEIYTTGWQGIAHWTPNAGWLLEKPTYFYYISAVAEVGGSENRSVWAVGLSGEDELGWGDKSHGAIYRLAWATNKWISEDLTGVKFAPGQGFYDLLLDDDRMLAVGARGLTVRGERNKGGAWKFEQVPPVTDEPLLSVARHGSVIYVVGQNGTILISRDEGRSWHQSQNIVDVNGYDLNLSGVGLTRIRFFHNQGWILGGGIVLKSIALPPQ